LPTATCFEKDGTFTNEDNRVQRLWQAILPLGEAELDLALLQRLAKAMSVELPAGEAEDVFAALAVAVPAFGGMSYESLGDQGAVLGAAAGVVA
jgi:formate dehydrogenase major subunit